MINSLPTRLSSDLLCRGSGLRHRIIGLERTHFKGMPPKRLDSIRRRDAGRRGGEAGDLGAQRAGADRLAVLERLPPLRRRSEEHTSELQSLMRNSFAVFCLKKKIRH